MSERLEDSCSALGPCRVLAVVAAGVGLFWQDGGSPFPFTTLRGQPAQIYGQGLYRYDSVLIATGYRVADAFTLVVAIPLLVLAVLLYRRSSLIGRLLLTGTLEYFAYNYGSLAFGAAYNNLFLHGNNHLILGTLVTMMALLSE